MASTPLRWGDTSGLTSTPYMTGAVFYRYSWTFPGQADYEGFQDKANSDYNSSY